MRVPDQKHNNAAPIPPMPSLFPPSPATSIDMASTPSSLAPAPPAIAVFGGGTACNCFCRELARWNPAVTHVLPVSDDGGSSAEIARILGGPAIGDIRSRLLRLAARQTREERHVQRLLGHRLSSADPATAEREWREVVDGTHELWAQISGISEPYAQALKTFLRHFDEAVRRAEPEAGEPFNFAGGSVGNFFFTGARLFFQSLPTAIFLWSKIARIPEATAVLPVLSSHPHPDGDGPDAALTLAAELESGEVILGQHEISHPNPKAGDRRVDKAGEQAPLPARVRRIFYVDGVRSEVAPRAYAPVLDKVSGASMLVYSMGSLYTSIVPILVVPGVGEAVAAVRRPKVLLLNAAPDRETSTPEGPLGAADYVRVIARAGGGFRGGARGGGAGSVRDFVTHLFVPEGGQVPLAEDELRDMGVEVRKVPSRPGGLYDPEALVEALESLVEFPPFDCK
mmetsp:Transcript_4965/g.14058  ORF Transcript_4965/g.14058 Transcript_4965/m.14058 type:complete len:455 (-) Transcript_4965:59-1423(-)